MSAPRILRTLEVMAPIEPAAVWEFDLSQLPAYAGWTGPRLVNEDCGWRPSRRKVVAVLLGVGVVGLAGIGPQALGVLPAGPGHSSAATRQGAATVEASLYDLRSRGWSGADRITCPSDSVLVDVSGRIRGTGVAVGSVRSPSESLTFALYPVGDGFSGQLYVEDGALRAAGFGSGRLILQPGQALLLQVQGADLARVLTVVGNPPAGAGSSGQC